MSVYRFEVRQELVTYVEIEARSEQEARERMLDPEAITALSEPIHGDMRVVLRSAGEVDHGAH